MRIKRIKLYTKDLKSEKRFYSEDLDFKIQDDKAQSFSVTVGWTNMTFEESRQQHIYHYCFLIPCNQLAEALDWFEQRTNIIEVSAGNKTQHFESWNADSFYFYYASGNLAECIVRYDLKNDSVKPFDQNSILCLNEIGFPTRDIKSVNDKLTKFLNTSFWKGDLERFGTHGNQEGLILLPNYDIKKHWFPTDLQIRPEPFGLSVEQGDEYHLDFLHENSQLS